jgi:FdhE protein
MNNSWDRWIQRADGLAAKMPEAAEMLAFYSRLLHSQKEVYEYLQSRRGWLPSGALELDLSVLRVVLPKFLTALQSNAPDAIASEARHRLNADTTTLDEMLLAFWRAPSDEQFFAKAFLQPYARWLAETGAQPVDRAIGAGENRCPFCAGKPQLAVLKLDEPGADVGSRKLLCSLCLTEWTFRRVVCASCGEERAPQLGYFQAEQLDYVRIDVCETCKHYIKSIDLTRLGLAVPLVDEVATAALDLWARERGYMKIEMNLIGL